MGLGMSHISIAYTEFKKFNKSENILNSHLLKKDKLVKKNKKKLLICTFFPKFSFLEPFKLFNFEKS